MECQIDIAAPALEDIDGAINSLEQFSAAVAARWQAGLNAAIATLRTHPDRYPLAHESELCGNEIRQMLYGKRNNVYRVLYSVDVRVVRVLHVRHASRDWLTPDDLE